MNNSTNKSKQPIEFTYANFCLNIEKGCQKAGFGIISILIPLEWNK
jgi:hypothetical protein